MKSYHESILKIAQNKFNLEATTEIHYLFILFRLFAKRIKLDL